MRRALARAVAAGLAGAGLLAAAPAAPAAPAAERDLARLAFVHSDTIHTVAADGSDRRPLVKGDSPRYSPDGRWIAYTQVDERDRESLWIASTDGTQPRRLAGNAEGGDWSPSGEELAFASFRGRGRQLESRIEVIRADGSARRVIVRRAFHRDRAGVWEPAWAPDGQRLLYTQERHTRYWRPRPSQIRSVALDGTDDRLLLGRAATAAFSPDGRHIAFSDFANTRGESCNSDYCWPNADLALARSDGSDRRAILRTKADEGGATWSPDGTRIAFSSGRNIPYDHHAADTEEIYTISPDGSCLTWLTNGLGASTSPAWEPGPGAAAAPFCGDSGREPLGEVRPPLRAFGSWWVGPRLGTAMLTDVFERTPDAVFTYDECSAFDPRDCVPLFTLYQHDSCEGLRIYGGRKENLLSDVRDLRRARGRALVGTSRDFDWPTRSLVVLTGRAWVIVRIDGPATRRHETALHARVIGALQRVARAPAQSLPAPVMPRRLKQKLPPRLRAGVRTCPAR